MSRRQFLAGCSACAVGGASLLGLGRTVRAEPAKSGKPRVRLVFTYVPSDGPIWPNIGYDFERRKRQLLAGLKAACPDVELLPVVVQNPEQAKKVLADADQVDGYLVYMLGLWTGAPRVIAASGKPTVFADDLYGGSGEFLIDYAGARRTGHNVVGVSSSRLEDVAAAVRCFGVLKKPGATVENFMAAGEKARRNAFGKPGDLSCPDDVIGGDVGQCLEKLRSTKILCVGRKAGEAGIIRDTVGAEVISLEFAEMQDAYLKADRDEAAEWADRWTRDAEKIIEPSRETIEQSAAMYLAMKQLLNRHDARAITVFCLPGFYGGHITAYPCLGFRQLNDDGLVGACESDLRSTVAMLTMGYLTGRPGYISDPVIDTSKYQIIYAHCVAPTKVLGPEGPMNAYHLRNHSEDRKGAAVRSLMPLGRMTTTLEMDFNRRELLFHQGKSVENVDEDMACRSKLAVEVKGDLDKLLTMWDQWSWHRVTVYGDAKESLKEFAKAAGFAFVEEA
jgi:hypothetical protein